MLRPCGRLRRWRVRRYRLHPVARSRFNDRTTETHAAVTWNGPGSPIVLTLYGADGEAAAVPLLPKRALTLAGELLERGVQAIKADPAAPWSPPAACPP